MKKVGNRASFDEIHYSTWSVSTGSHKTAARKKTSSEDFHTSSSRENSIHLLRFLAIARPAAIDRVLHNVLGHRWRIGRPRRSRVKPTQSRGTSPSVLNRGELHRVSTNPKSPVTFVKTAHKTGKTPTIVRIRRHVGDWKIGNAFDEIH